MKGLTWPERALTATAAVALALSAFVVWSWAGRPEPVFEMRTELERAPAAVDVLRSADPSNEALRSWFGVSEPLTLVPETLPETELDLMLEGVFVDADPSRSSALIAADGVVERYFPGDEVASAQLIQVHGNLVVIRRGGESEALRFPRLNRLTGKGSESVDSQPRRQ